MGVYEDFAALPGNGSIAPWEWTRLLMRLRDLAQTLGAPGDWGYGTSLAELTRIIHLQMNRLASDRPDVAPSADDGA